MNRFISIAVLFAGCSYADNTYEFKVGVIENRMPSRNTSVFLIESDKMPELQELIDARLKESESQGQLLSSAMQEHKERQAELKDKIAKYTVAKSSGIPEYLDVSYQQLILFAKEDVLKAEQTIQSIAEEIIVKNRKLLTDMTLVAKRICLDEKRTNMQGESDFVIESSTEILVVVIPTPESDYLYQILTIDSVKNRKASMIAELKKFEPR